MLKFLIFFLPFITSFIVQAQTFTVTPNPASIEVDLNTASNPYEIVAESMIQNNTSDTLYLKWERIVNDKPDCWETSVFGVWIQSPPFVDSSEFDLYPNNDGFLSVYAFIDSEAGNSNAGEAEVVLKITNLHDATDTLLVEFNFLATGNNNCTTGISEIEYEALQIYPNPITDFFNLSETQDVEYLMVYNMMGNQIYQYNVTPSQNYDVGDLPYGVYLITDVTHFFERYI